MGYAFFTARTFCKKKAYKIWIIFAICIVVSLLVVLAYPDTQGSRVMHVPHQLTLGHENSNHGLMETSSHHSSVKLPSVTPLTKRVSSFTNPSTGDPGAMGGKAEARRPNTEQRRPPANNLVVGSPRHRNV
ncbi:uncharacterized protein LOC118414363 [Branchiostoma floridae]|uniref:Uncharacterized protein LOC118414363 n=1 Tax=Branchiostoma floridae TaxID=7739 RepID=A0A9J7MPE6_BRAFL|nr:uncharacterized protein LOC118414363 [Branchiostoma floridae]